MFEILKEIHFHQNLCLRPIEMVPNISGPLFKFSWKHISHKENLGPKNICFVHSLLGFINRGGISKWII